jgi:hypothetical protein
MDIALSVVYLLGLMGGMFILLYIVARNNPDPEVVENLAKATKWYNLATSVLEDITPSTLSPDLQLVYNSCLGRYDLAKRLCVPLMISMPGMLLFAIEEFRYVCETIQPVIQYVDNTKHMAG